MAEQIVARLLIEILGAPKEHVEETIKLYIERIKEEKEVTIRKEEYGEAEEREKGLFAAFVEIEVVVQSIANLVWLCFDFMPSSVEILEPESLSYSQHEFTDFLNDLQGRLHKFDGIIKQLHAENKVLRKNSLTLAKNVFVVALKEGPKTMEELVGLSGIPEQTATKFLKQLEKDGKIKEDEGKYIRS